MKTYIFRRIIVLLSVLLVIIGCILYYSRYVGKIVDVVDMMEMSKVEVDNKYGLQVSDPSSPDQSVSYRKLYQFQFTYDTNNNVRRVCIGPDSLRKYGCHFENWRAWVGRLGMADISKPSKISYGFILWNNWHGYRIEISRTIHPIPEDDPSFTIEKN